MSNVLRELITVYVLPRVGDRRLNCLISGGAMDAMVVNVKDYGREIRANFRHYVSSRRSERTFKVVRGAPHPIPKATLHRETSPFHHIGDISPFPVNVFYPRGSVIKVMGIPMIRNFPMVNVNGLFPTGKINGAYSAPINMDVFGNLNHDLIRF